MRRLFVLGKGGEQPYVEQPNVYAVMHHIHRQSILEVRLPLFSVNTNNSDILAYCPCFATKTIINALKLI
jgi:hypothetical protein